MPAPRNSRLDNALRTEFLSYCRLVPGRLDTSCMEWQRSKDSGGYGMLKRTGLPEDRVHRLSWRLFCGQIPEGKFVLHKCDNRACANPLHLYIGTALDNSRDAFERSPGVGYPHWKGSAHPVAKLTERNAAAIKRSTAPQRKLAAEYGVDQALIWRIRNGQSWRHVA